MLLKTKQPSHVSIQSMTVMDTQHIR
jgi:hypothetical protein